MTVAPSRGATYHSGKRPPVQKLCMHPDLKEIIALTKKFTYVEIL
jgi:hypothetical protein